MTSHEASQQKIPMPLRRITISALLVWTAVAMAVYIWEVADNKSFLRANATAIARASYEKDLAFRRWAAKHGGVYVPATAETPPNPHLHAEERDITTPSGRQLTLMNPAYMTRQVYESMRLVPDAPQGHITSLKPIRPENAPDPWERKALEAIEKGVEEVSEFQEVDGKKIFRLMHGLKAEKPCLTCHAAQGYREGDVRGGISVTIPVSGLEGIMNSSNSNHFAIVTFVWGLGTLGICYSSRAVGRGARALKESEERYRQQFQQSRAMMLIIDPEGGAIVDANPAACAFYGYERETLLALKISDINISPPAELARCIAAVQEGSNGQFLARHRLCDGSIVDVEVFSNPVAIQGKALLHSIISDISDRKAAERELRDKMYFAENLILNSTTPTFVINSDHQVLIWNRALEELTGIEAQEVVGTCEHWQAFYPSRRACLADIVIDEKSAEASKLYSHISRSRLLPDGLHAEGDYSFHNRKCRLVFSAAPIRDRDGSIIAAIETLEDITERISLEAQLFQAQKMESVGVLAGGIAHDFNNVLTVINGYADLLTLTLKDDEQNLFYAREIAASVERAADMTRSLLAFSGKQEVMLQYDDLNLILSGIRKSLGRLIREDIALSIQPGAERLPVRVDRVQIEQLLINLVVNARDAMGTGGTITVSTVSVENSDTLVEGGAVIPAGRYACLCVGDSGSGMDGETLAHIFEPFFTTKERGKGTGLGLAIVHSIVTKHNGYISVISSVGYGTQFRVYLPNYAGEVTPQRLAEAPELIHHHGTETVLMVEDDAAIMSLHKEVLGRYGYTILTASDGVEAVELFDAHIDEIQVAVVDVIMPRMNGREVAEYIRLHRPELPIIMTSGYTDEIIDRAAFDTLKLQFLPKPVRPLDMLAAIRSCHGMKE